jgi:hypothetical protein
VAGSWYRAICTSARVAEKSGGQKNFALIPLQYQKITIILLFSIKHY